MEEAKQETEQSKADKEAPAYAITNERLNDFLSAAFSSRSGWVMKKREHIPSFQQYLGTHPNRVAGTQRQRKRKNGNGIGSLRDGLPARLPWVDVLVDPGNTRSAATGTSRVARGVSCRGSGSRHIVDFGIA